MTKEARDALAKEIAFVAVGMRERQFKILLSAGDATQEECDDFLDFLRQGLSRSPNSDYPEKGGRLE